MTSWTLAKRSIRFYWRTHLGVLLGVALCTTILVGALLVGDSVQYTLKTLALARLGKVQLALTSGNRYFSAELAEELASELNAKAAPALQIYGIASNDDGSARVNRAQVIGIDKDSWKLLDTESTDIWDAISGDEVIINQRLARQIAVDIGDEVLLRVEEASLLPRDAPMSTAEDFSVAFRMTVKGIVPDSGFGRFSLQVSQIPPFNAFVPIDRLQQKLDLVARANMLLIGDNLSLDVAAADSALKKHWKLYDAGLEFRSIPEQEMHELRSSRVFLDPPIVDAAVNAVPETEKILTYFVNEIRKENHSTPYSMVSAINPAANSSSSIAKYLLAMPDDGILINSWLAEDIQAKIGDTLKLTYLIFGPMRKLEERTDSFQVYKILPMEGAALDPKLMPDFPGLSDAEHCREWEPGITIDLDKIRDKDEEYWDLYHGTPKAFIKLEAGQRMWSNRFGNLTAVRYPFGQTPSHSQIEMAIRDKLDPASVGMFFQPVREQAIAASAEAIDFGQLFLGLSFFLITAALLLTGLLFVFGIQQRTEETGTLLAMGFHPRQVRRMFLLEGGALALLGGLIGTVTGILYTKIVLSALSTVWQDAVKTSAFYFHAEPVTLAIGAVAGIVIAVITIWITLFRQARRPARELITGSGFGLINMSTRSRLSLSIAIVSIVAAVVVLIMANNAGAFFISGALLLIGGIGLSRIILTRYALWIARDRLTGMGMRNSSRRWGRSLATIGLLACGSFLVIAVGANRSDSTKNSDKRWSGTGGFALYGETTLPVLHDLNSADGREAYGLNSKDLKGVKFVPFRVHDGDDASCLNLNRAQAPRLLGVRPEDLQEREAFTFAERLDETIPPWSSLANSTDNEVSSVSDQNTITWSIGKSLGDTLVYRGESGRTLNVKLNGAIASSILQGSILISEEEFIKHYPSEGGYRTFLIDAPHDNIAEVSRILTRSMRDVGLELTPTVRRLAEFGSVQNTYLAIFQSLGGLALMLGSLGLGIVVLRNVMERRGELALLRAVGFRKRSLQWLIFSEHWLLLLLGLACGVISGIVAVLPALRSPGADIPYASLAVTLAAILVSGALWTWLATRFALRGALLSALRNE